MGDLSNSILGTDQDTQEEQLPAPHSPVGLSQMIVQGTDDDSTRLGLSIKYGSQKNPDAATRVLNLQAKTGLPEDLIERNLDTIEEQAKNADFDPVKFRQQSPVVSQWLAEHPNHASVAYEDIGKLGYLERQVKHFTHQFELGMRTTELTDIGTSAILGNITPEQRKRQTDIEREMNVPTDYGIHGFFEGIPGSIANFAPMFGQTMFGKAKYGAAGAVVGAGVGAAGGALAGGVGALPGALAGAATGFGLGFHYGTGVEIARQESSLAYLDYEKIKDENGNPINRETALGAAAMVGIVNGSIGMIPFEELTKTVPGLRALGRTQVKQMLKSPTLREAFSSYASTIGKQMAIQGGVGFIQQMIRSTSADLLKMSQDGSLEKKTTSQILAHLFSEENLVKAAEMAKTGAQAAVVTAGTAFPDLARDARRARSAQATSTAFMELGNQVRDLKVFQRVPEATQEVISRLVKDGPSERVYAPIESWNTYWQSKNADPRAVAEEVLGNSKAYDEAIATGQDLSIPTARYAVTIAPSDHNAHFVQELRSSPLEMNAREAQEFIKQVQEAEKTQAEAAKVEEQVQAPEQEQTEAIKQQVTDQLKAAGIDERTAGTYAQLFDAFTSLAQRTGQKPLDLFNQYKLNIGKPQEAAFITPELNPLPGGTSTLEQGAPKAAVPAAPKTIPVPSQSPLGFFSQTSYEVAKMDFNSMPAKDFANRIKNIQGLKAEELEFTGLNEFLKLKEERGEKVSKQEVEEYLKHNGVELQQVVLGGDFEGVSSISGLSWGESEQRSLSDIDPYGERVSEEAGYYLNENQDWVDMNRSELHAELLESHTNHEGVVDEAALNEEIQDKLQERAEKAAEESLENPNGPYAEFEVEESTTGWKLEGNDEQGWYNRETDTHFETGLEEAKIQLAAKMIEKGAIEGDKAQLTREEDVKWKLPRGEMPEYKVMERKKKAYIKDHKKELLEKINTENENDEYFKGQSAADQKKSISRSLDWEAEKALTEQYEDRTNAKNKISVQIEHPLLDANVAGNDKKGYVLTYYNAHITQDRRGGYEKKPSSEKTVELQAHTLEEAQKEAVQHLIDKELVTAKRTEQATPEEINKATGPSKFERFKVPGGENYREVLLTLPQAEAPLGEAMGNFSRRVKSRLGKDSFSIEDLTDAEMKEYETIQKLPQAKDEFYYKNHFDQANILAHVRLTDRVDSEGRKTLFIEEVQSDWHQQGRERGYKGEIPFDEKASEAKRLELADKFNAIVEPLDINTKIGNALDNSEQFAKLPEEAKALAREYFDLWKAERAETTKVPNAPFKNTDAWAALAMKRMIRMAVEQGYDAIAWTPAEVHVKRWGTDSIGWVKKEAAPFEIVYRNPNNNKIEERRGGTFQTREEAETALKKDPRFGENHEIIEGGDKPHFLVGAVEQRGGHAGGIDIEEAARAQGKLLERNGERVTTKEELQAIVADTLGRERNERSLESLTDSLWKQMQEKETGSKFPRKEGMEFFYDNMIPRKVVPAILKKLDPAAKVEVTKIDTSSEPGKGFEAGREHELMEVLTVPLSETLKSKAKEGFSLFQPGEDGQPRGRITFKGKEFNIELLKTADLSTFLHETGHFYLEVMGDLAHSETVPEQVKNDYNTILKWLGAESREKITREHHEKFADGFMAYLEEGKAPSSHLRQAFARFKAWLTEIYSKFKQANFDLTPEVRGVFDRLLATDEQITAAQNEQNMRPLFQDPKAVGMNEQEARSYNDAILEARQAAEENLNKKLMKEVTREQKARYKEAKEKVRTQIEEQVNAQPDQIARAVLQKGTLPDGSELPPGLEAMKLSREAIVESFGAERLKELPKPYVYTKEGGVHPDVAAELFGYTSGDEFLKALASSEDRHSLVERLTDERMKQEHGDLLTDGKLPEEAMKAVHTEKRAQLLRKELEYLATNRLPEFKGMIRKIARRVPTVEIIRNQAEHSILNKQIREINPYLYQRAEARAAKEAVDAFLKGDMEGAFEAKQRELLNHELNRAATDAKDQVSGINDYLSKFNKDSTRRRMGKAGGEYLAQIEAIMDRFDFRDASLKAIEKRKNLVDWVNEQQEQGLTVDVPEKLLQEAYRKNFKDLTYQELSDIRDTVKNIEHLASLKNKLLANKKTRDLLEARSGIIASIAANHSMKSEPFDFAPGLKERFKTGMKELHAAHTRMEFLFEWLDGNKPHGPAWETLFKPMADAENNENTMMRDVVTNVNRIFDVYPRAERAMWFFKKTHIPEIGNSMNKANMLAVALNWGNAYNREALMKGYGWTESQVQAILKHLDKRDWSTVQNVWDYINSYWPQIEKMEKELNGIAPAKVEATPVETPHGTFPGGYYPIVFESKLSYRQHQLEERANVKEMFGGQWAKAMTRKGHVKERENTGGKPLKLDLSGMTQHLTNVVHDLAFRPAVIDVSRLINISDVREAIETSVGREMYKQLNPWLSSIASDRRGDYTSPIEGLLGHARKGATVVNMGWKFTTAIVQFSGYAISSKELGRKYAALGLQDAFAKPFEMNKKWEFITERSDMMRDRIGNYDRDVRDALKRLNVAGVKPGPLSVVDAYTKGMTDSWFSMIGMMDIGVAMPTWLGAYRKAMDGALEHVAKGDEHAAVDYADSIVRQSQGAGGAKDLALVQRGSEAHKLFTMFYSYFNMLYNQFSKTANQYKVTKNVPELIASVALIWFLPAVMDDITLGRSPGTDKDAEEWAKYLAKKELAYPFQSVVLLRDVVNGMDKFGYTPSAAFDAFAHATKVGQLGAKIVTGQKDEIERNDLKSLFMATGYATHLPARQLWLSGEYFHDWMTGEEQPENAVEGLWRALVTGKKRK